MKVHMWDSAYYGVFVVCRAARFSSATVNWGFVTCSKCLKKKPARGEK